MKGERQKSTQLDRNRDGTLDEREYAMIAEEDTAPMETEGADANGRELDQPLN